MCIWYDVCIWVCMHMVVGYKYVNCVYAYGCVCVWVCMHRGVVCLHVCELCIG